MERSFRINGQPPIISRLSSFAGIHGGHTFFQLNLFPTSVLHLILYWFIQSHSFLDVYSYSRVDPEHVNSISFFIRDRKSVV